MSVTQDATSLKFLPASGAEWTLQLAGTGISNPFLLYLLQEASGSVADTISGITGAVVNGTYAQAVSGWTRKGIKLGSPNGTATIGSTSASLPDISTTSMMALAWRSLPTYTAGLTTEMSDVTLGPTFGSQLAAEAIYDGTNIDEVIASTGGGFGGGGHSVLGTHNESGVHPIIVQWNHAAGTAAIQTNLETIVPTLGLAGTLTGKGFWLGGDNSNTWESAGGTYMYFAAWSGAAAELTATQRATLLSLGNTGPVTSVTLAPSSATIATVSGTQTLVATGHYQDGSTTANVTSSSTGQWTSVWTTSDASKATVSSSGVVTAVANGTATITCTTNGIAGTCAITVATAPTLVSIAVTPAFPAVLVGASQQMVATGTYSDTSTADVTSTAAWTTSDVTQVTIGASTGLAHSVGVTSPGSGGSAIVTATIGGVSGSTTIETFVNLTSITIVPPFASIANGDSLTLTGTAHYSDGESVTITTQAVWSSSNPAIASVPDSTRGTVDGATVGTATITANLFGVLGTATVTVLPSAISDAYARMMAALLPPGKMWQ